jgi:hypothetical protein
MREQGTHWASPVTSAGAGAGRRAREQVSEPALPEGTNPERPVGPGNGDSPPLKCQSAGVHRRDRPPQRRRRARRPGGKLMHAAMSALFVTEGISAT